MAVGKDKRVIFNPVKGVRLGVTKAGIRYQNRKDLVLMAFDEGSVCAGMFTRNAFCAAPVIVAKRHLAELAGHEQNVPFVCVINTGNANAGTGEQGVNDALETCQELADQISFQPYQVLPFSTGVIGESMPMTALKSGLSPALESLSENHWQQAAEGILTTDTRVKGASVKYISKGSDITITGICKGAGMIRPDMATMLAFIVTDAKISRALLQELLFDAVSHSFNRVTIDGDTSTNDSCLLISTGKSTAAELERGTSAFDKFQKMLNSLFIDLAQQIVRDGEGASKFVEIRVEEALSEKEALEIAYTVAQSPLVKTALFASDPNWGRILAAVGRAKVSDLDVSTINIDIGDVVIVHNGVREPAYSEEKAQDAMNKEEILIRIRLGRGLVSESVWTSDLSHDYIKINAEYRS